MSKKIGIIVEYGGKTDKGEIQTRENFWDDVVDRFDKIFNNKFKIEFDWIKPKEIQDAFKANYDVLIIKWDAANGDLKFGSDITLDQIKYEQANLKEFVRKGGIFIVECQSNSWLPSQDAYNVILHNFGTVQVEDNYPSKPGFYVRRVGIPYTRYKFKFKYKYSLDNDHPLLKYLPEKIYPCPDLNTISKLWFSPKESVPNDIHCMTYPKKVYSGWFTSFSRDWKPLLYDEDRKHAVMIWRPYEKGAVIASTMFLASSFIPQMLINILSKDFGEEMRNYTKSVNDNLRGRRISIFASTVTGLVEIMFGIVIFGGFITLPPPYNYIMSFPLNYILFGTGLILGTVLAIFTLSKKLFDNYLTMDYK